MNRLTFFFLLIFGSNLLNGQTHKIETEHFKVKYDIEAEEYAKASLKVLELAWTIAIRNGYNLPDKIKFTIKNTDRSVLYFDRKSLKGITLEYKTMDSFNSPKNGGKNNIYGLCHELGHLIMYNTTTNKNNWMSYNFRESWADFWGNTVIDSIHSELGIDFWPNPYNYLEFSGSEYMKKRIDQNNSKIADFNKSVQFWIDLNSIIGFNKMNQIFE
ncbi:MAG: hypothetical protein Q8K02_18415, partial [Flavobacterium sp.]|nr:hypothetical protein [Flavobacterium sp.]